MPPRQASPRGAAWWRGPAAVAVGVGILIVLAQTGAGHVALRGAGIEKPAKRYTALSFTDPGALQGHLPLGHFSALVGFTIMNASQATSQYQWSVRLVDGKRVTQVATGTTVIPAGDAVDERRTVTGLCQSGKLSMVVSLASPAESIDFLANCGG
jgi:hypothetical protein